MHGRLTRRQAIQLVKRLPEGLVVFLFTDIEASTPLWDAHPHAMRMALARHNALLQTTAETHGGWVFKTIGDAYCIAFARVSEALEAALVVQFALNAEDSDEIGPLRVRMALHVGEADPSSSDYFGPPLNRVARLLALAHGSQILLSQTASVLAADALPPGASLLFLGEQELRGLHRPEPVSQLCHPALPAAFPVLRSPAAFPHNLPPALNRFIGREVDRQALARLLGGEGKWERPETESEEATLHSSRLFTLTGSGGAGKTRLAVEAARDALSNFPDGVWLVDLAGLIEESLVPRALAQILGVREEGRETLESRLVQTLVPRRMLILLDNCEHLIAACARFAETLLRNCPYVCLLATSREPLAIAGETLYPVLPLSLPPETAATSADLQASEAAQLFLARARAALPSLIVTAEMVPAITRICRKLDGIPLALELAAARVRVLSLPQIADRLDNQLPLLTEGRRTAPPRHRTMEALIAWSYGLLLPEEQILLRRLSVFANGWTLDAAYAVCGGEDCPDVLNLLSQLVEKSLVFVAEQGTESRYRLLESVRQFAQAQAQGEAETNQARLATWASRFATGAETKLTGANQGLWLARLEAEQDNFRSVLQTPAPSFIAETALQLAASLWRFWVMRGHIGEGRDHLRRMLAHASRATPVVRARALNAAGNLAQVQGDLDAARACYEEALLLRRQAGDAAGAGATLSNLGALAQEQGDLDRARELYEEGLASERQRHDTWGMAYSLNNLGLIAMRQDDLPQAAACCEEALTLCRNTGDGSGVAMIENNLGDIALCARDYTRARRHYANSLTSYRALDDESGVAACLESAGRLFCAQERWAQAEQAFAGAAMRRHLLGIPLPPREQQEHDRALISLRNGLNREPHIADLSRAALPMLEEQIFILLDRGIL